MSDFPTHIVSLDLGQSQDYSALSVLEQPVYIGPQTYNTYPWSGTSVGWNSILGFPDSLTDALIDHAKEPWPEKPPIQVRHLERFPLGTGYPEIVKRVAALVQHMAAQIVRPTLVLDLTGVGRPVYDLFVEAGLYPVGITITGGNTATMDDHGYRVPKRDLVSAVSAGLQSRRLQIAASLEVAGVLVKELQNFKVTIDPRTAHDSYAAWRDGDHDDLVLSVAMGVWYRDWMWIHYDAMMREWRESPATVAR